MKKITFLFFAVLVSSFTWSQCIVTTSFGTENTPNDGSVTSISTCSFSGEYNTINNVIIGDDYEFTNTSSGVDGYITITDDTDSVIAFGPSPLTVTAITVNVVRLHVTNDDTCADDSDCHASTVQNLTVAANGCFDPSAILVSNIALTTADISWTAGGAPLEVDFNVEVFLTGETANPVFSNANVAGTTVSATGLTATTSYDVYVTANCSGSTPNSATVGPLTFNTICLTFPAPYTEGFENGGVIPACWSMSGGEDWLFNLSGPNNVGDNGTISGNTMTNGYYAVVDASGNDGPTILLSPLVDVSTLTTPALSFYVISSSNNVANAELLVEVWDGAAFNTVETINEDTANLEWELIITDLSALTITGDVQVRFTFSEPLGGLEDDIAIDDVTFSELPSCTQPNSLTVANVESSSADLGWTETGTATTWNIELVNITDGGTQTMMATSTGVSNPYMATELTDATDYEYYVQSDCGVDGTSVWFGPFAFTTNCEAFVAPYLENFEDGFTVSSNPFMVENCWSATSNGYYWELAAFDDTSSGGTGPDSSITTGNYFFTEGSSGTDGTIINLTTPLVDLSGLTAPALTFNYHMFGEDMGNLDVLVNGTDNVFNLTGEQQAAATDVFELAVIDLSAYMGQTISVVFRGTRGSAFQSDMAIDNVSFDEIPDCDAPVATFTVTTDCVAEFSVDIDVTDLGSGTSYDVQSESTSVGTITAIGITTVGPFPIGTPINLTIVHPDDAICNVLENGLEETCPPATIGTLTLNGACGVANDTATNAVTAGEIQWYELIYDGGCTDFTIETGGSLDTELGIYDDAGNLLSNNDDGGTGSLSLLSLTGQPAGTYYIAVGVFNTAFGVNFDVTSSSGNTGDITVSVNTVSVIPNDECAGAIAVVLGADVAFDNTGATDSGAASCYTGTVSDLWYSFVAPTTGAGGTGEVTITVGGSATQFALFSDCTTQVSCNTATNAGLVGGATYFVSVTDDGTNKVPGASTLRVDDTVTLSTTDFDSNSIFSYYPNPVNNTLTLKAQQAISNVSVFNMLGQEVIKTSPNAVSNDINMSNLQSGAYFVQVTVGTNIETVRIIKN